MLKRINLRHSHKLLEAEELSEALNLEQIDLYGCENLQSFPDIHQLQKLRVVDLSGCTQIKTFPEFPSNVILKCPGISIKTFFSPVTFTIKSFLDNQPKPQKRIANPDMVESTPTFAMKCQKVLEMSRSLQWKFPNLRIDLNGYANPSS